MLKPGGRFIFVEMLRGACQGTLQAIEREPGWEVDVDPSWVSMFNDPHAIGVAIKVPPLAVGHPNLSQGCWEACVVPAWALPVPVSDRPV